MTTLGAPKSSSSIRETLAEIAEAISAIQNGEYRPYTLEKLLHQDDEFGNLAHALDAMARASATRDRRLQMLRNIIPIGVKLSAEKDFNRLLESILVEAQHLTNADAGTFYLLKEDKLHFVIVRNTSLNMAMGGTSGNKITLPFIPLHDQKGHANHANVATHVALENERVNIADAYTAKGFDFSGTKTFDERTGYRSQSFLTIPLEDEYKQVIGVLQLINAYDIEEKNIISFDEDEVMDSLVLLASAALAGYIREESLRKEIAQLRIEVDQAKQARQVAEITETAYFKKLQIKAKGLRQQRKREK